MRPAVACIAWAAARRLSLRPASATRPQRDPSRADSPVKSHAGSVGLAWETTVQPPSSRNPPKVTTDA